MEFRHLQQEVKNPFCKRYPITTKEWIDIIEQRAYRLRSLYTFSTFPSLGKVPCLERETTGAACLDEIIALDIPGMGSVPLKEQGVFCIRFSPLRLDRQPKQGMARIWGCCSTKSWTSWILVEISHERRLGGTLWYFEHHYPIFVHYERISLENLIDKKGVAPIEIWNKLGGEILRWSQCQEDRARHGRELLQIIRDQELILSALKPREA